MPQETHILQIPEKKKKKKEFSFSSIYTNGLVIKCKKKKKLTSFLILI